MDWQHKAAISGIFSGHPISGTYTWEDAPGPQGFTDFSSLSLMYNYHHINLEVMGNLTVINPTPMEWSSIGPYNEDRHYYVVDGDFRLATGLHLHLGDVIHLMRGGNNPSSQLEQVRTAYDNGPATEKVAVWTVLKMRDNIINIITK